MKQLLFVLISLSLSAQAKSTWTKLLPSINYHEITKTYHHGRKRNVKYHVFKVKRNLVSAKLKSFHKLKNKERMTLQETRNSEKAVLAISGGFFSSDFKKPTGLVVIKNKVISPISQQLSGVIWIKDGQVNLTATKEFKSQNQPTFAIQGHPCLVDFPNKLGIHQKTTKFTHRVAIGQKGDNIFFIITDKNYSGVSLLELAKILQGPIENGGLACDIAINLDGGPAPGISVKAGKLSLEIEEGWQLPNCILLKDKKLKSSQ